MIFLDLFLLNILFKFNNDYFNDDNFFMRCGINSTRGIKVYVPEFSTDRVFN